MIKTFKNKDLQSLWETGKSKIDNRLHKRIIRRLDTLEAASQVSDVNIPGYDFHMLRGFNPARYTIHVNGPWCITFEFIDGHAIHVDLEQYH
ncbi:plasmid maintenance system killer protein [Bartonella australis AUST/NH1]|uniref:Plasmid maintenance system killer protein n=1 Tax=Bartonella australis (strain Aust/NH1) TaxID=1094489 RepID=M1P2T5_BARAA|nr:type II toxin-antitoxin system RelE/ParE family toxin [Bartonella australis]AGF74130.1 plasmid maintenance system killer protein [Bartonella australis AUST/NH1]